MSQPPKPGNPRVWASESSAKALSFGRNEGVSQMKVGGGLIRGHLITLRRFLLTFWRDYRAGAAFKRRGGGPFLIDLFRSPGRGNEPTVTQDFKTAGLFTVEYPDERLPV